MANAVGYDTLLNAPVSCTNSTENCTITTMQSRRVTVFIFSHLRIKTPFHNPLEWSVSWNSIWNCFRWRSYGDSTFTCKFFFNLSFRGLSENPCLLLFVFEQSVIIIIVSQSLTHSHNLNLTSHSTHTHTPPRKTACRRKPNGGMIVQVLHFSRYKCA